MKDDQTGLNAGDERETGYRLAPLPSSRPGIEERKMTPTELDRFLHQLYDTLTTIAGWAQLAHRAKLPMPRVYLIPEEAPNAFAAGRNPDHAAVAVTVGLVRMLNRDELAGVIAHELSHVKHRDTLVMTIAASLAGALSFLANMAMWSALFGGFGDDDEEGGVGPIGGLLGIIVASIAASLIQMAISRSSEFMADARGAQLTRNPLALAGALQKLESWKRQVPMHAGSPATAHLFIVNPLSGGGLASLFSTHPSTQDRIERLRDMAHRSMAVAA